MFLFFLFLCSQKRQKETFTDCKGILSGEKTRKNSQNEATTRWKKTKIFFNNFFNRSKIRQQEEQQNKIKELMNYLDDGIKMVDDFVVCDYATYYRKFRD